MGNNLEFDRTFLIIQIFFLIICSLLSIKNILFLFVTLIALNILILSKFKMKIYDSKPFYFIQLPILLLQGLILLYCYLYRAIYLIDLTLVILYIIFVLAYIMLLFVYIYYFHKKRHNNI
jgi:hypothetical protein